jgi:DNA topoisomerase-1
MPRLRRVDCSGPGIRRRRSGRGFVYLDEGGRITDPDTVARIRDLVIPPAWEDVWVCPDPLGHLQATGVDAAGRRQYLYHSAWRARRNQEKFDRMLRFAEALPRLRRRASADLARRGLARERVLACAARLLDVGFFRIGTESYAEENGTFGLATMRRDHVTLSRGAVTFDYPSKGGTRVVRQVVDPEVAAVVSALKRRRTGGRKLLVCREGTAWRDVRSADINDYVAAAAGGEFTAKDFRTWNATVLAAVALAISTEAARSPTAHKRAVARAMREVADYLGNTPAVCRSSYVDPRVVDRYRAGVTIRRTLEGLGDGARFGELSMQEAIEAAVLDMLEDAPVPRPEPAAA